VNHREVQLKPDESRLWPALAALASYAVLTIGLTWPVAAGLARDVPSDLGDPLLNAWILAWDATHLGQRWWNANIFHPHPLALAYSEHLLPQAIQILPFYAATKNPILCYNLLFLSTFTFYKQAHLAPLPGRVSAPDVAALYQFIAGLPEPCAIVELPLGEPAFDVRYVFYSTLHWKRIVNGYSGGAPVEYETLNSSLQEAIERPDRAWQAILRTQPTHAIVHEAYYAGGRGRAISDWLRVRGAQEIATFGTDVVFVIH